MVVSAVVAYLLSALLNRRASTQLESGMLGVVVPPLTGLTGLDERVRTALHWLSAGAVGAARGLNDTPKLAAVADSRWYPPGCHQTCWWAALRWRCWRVR